MPFDLQNKLHIYFTFKQFLDSHERERERETHAKPMPKRKERVLPVKPRTSPRPTALLSCFKLVIVVT